jgi:hypothetical protein
VGEQELLSLSARVLRLGAGVGYLMKIGKRRGSSTVATGGESSIPMGPKN